MKTKLKISKLFTGIIFILFPVFLFSQDFTGIGEKPFLTANGGISYNQIYYTSNDTNAFRDPFAFTIMANLNLSVVGWSIPLSATYSNRQWSYHQPFNQFSLHPTYKWIRTHIGYSSMSFSPYTLNGHQFLGGGVELTPPGKWKVSIMAGQMQKRILPDTSNAFDPAYSRFGTGLKTEYSSDLGTFGIDLFYAKDNPSSLPYETDSITILPEENIVIGFNAIMKITEKLNFNGYYALSTLTGNMLSPGSENTYFYLPGFKRRESTHQYHAFRMNLTYNCFLGAIGVGMERIDPGYKTLGSYYSNNDFVNYTFTYATQIKQKISFSLSSGIQHDDLNNLKGQQNNRYINNVNIGFNPSEKIGLTAFYSNFYNYTNVKTGFEDVNTTSPYGDLDTLDFTQISENIGSTLNYNFGSGENVKQSANLTINYQVASEKQSDNPLHAGNKFITGVLGHNASLTDKNMSFSTMFNYSKNIMDTIKTDMIGPSVSVRKAFFDKKLNTSFMFSYNATKINRESSGSNTVLRFTTGYIFKQKHNFNLSGVTIFRKKQDKSKNNDLTITFTYSYNFNLTKEKEKNDNKNQ